MKYLIASLLLSAAALAQSGAQLWEKPEEKWTKKDAERVLSSSPWAKRAETRTASSGRKQDSSVTVRWESARPVKLALQKLSLRPAIDDERCFAIAVVGLGADWIAVAPEAQKSDLLSAASLRYTGKAEVRPVDARLVQQPGAAPLVVFVFPRDEQIPTPGVFRVPFGIQKHRQGFEFKARISGRDITGTFPVKDMLCRRKLEL